MIIILEGVDKVGKTTLANYLAKELKLEIIKTSQPKTDDAAKEYLDIIDSLDPETDYLFDRFHLGEMIYGPIYREKGLSLPKFREIENKLMKFNPLVIYCWQDHKIIEKNFIKCNEETTKIEDIGRIDYRFRDILQLSKLPKIYYNYLENTFHQTKWRVINICTI